MRPDNYKCPERRHCTGCTKTGVIMTAVDGMISEFAESHEALEKDMANKIDGVSDKVSELWEGLSAHMKAEEASTDRLLKTLDRVDTNLGGLTSRIDELDKRAEARRHETHDSFVKVYAKLDSGEKRMDGYDKIINTASGGLAVGKKFWIIIVAMMGGVATIVGGLITAADWFFAHGGITILGGGA